MLLESFDGTLPPSDPKFYARHEAFLWQQLCPVLRRCALSLRVFMSTVCLPDSCAAALGVGAPGTGASLLQVEPRRRRVAWSSLFRLECLSARGIGWLEYKGRHWHLSLGAELRLPDHRNRRLHRSARHKVLEAGDDPGTDARCWRALAVGAPPPPPGARRFWKSPCSPEGAGGHTFLSLWFVQQQGEVADISLST